METVVLWFINGVVTDDWCLCAIAVKTAHGPTYRLIGAY